jgi:glycosyltransferase involved in cell wall biosynthesis
MSRLSVVIPTKDRCVALARTLAALEAQQGVEGALEAIVVDNGSGDDTIAMVGERAERAILPIHLLEHPDGGPAAARNAGVEAASGEIILLLGDDTEPADPGLARAHLELHAARNAIEYAVLGRITWTPRKPITPFMRWLENGGPQFHFHELSPGPVDASRYFYSSHLSLTRAVFERVGGFEVRFPSAAVEDTELGVRLADAGLELDYHPELLVFHDHPTTPEQSLRRAVVVGRSAALYNELHPDRPHSGIRPPRGAAWTAASAATPLLRVLARLPSPRFLRERIWLALTRGGYARGYRLGPIVTG